tara:strand:+ start:1587 stop:2411 length:825 start_codon:yes stop_codon:yes gene_type:complete
MRGLNELALFAGAGGGILGGHLLGWRTRVAVEIDPYARRVLLARQRDGMLPRFPIWDDVSTFDGKPWKGHIDVISGGFPCQDISIAGSGGGITGKRSGLWGEMARIVAEVVPQFVFVENSPALTSRGLGTVLGDLATLGFDARWGVLGAHHVGAPHRRDRIWILATHTERLNTLEQPQLEPRRVGSVDASRNGSKKQVADADSTGRKKQRRPLATSPELSAAECPSWWEAEPAVGRVANGVAHRVDRLRAIGNGQVPAVARLAFESLKGVENGQ